MAVSLLAQPHNVDGLVTISKLNSFTPNIHQLESVQSSRRHQLPSLKSIGDPERNSDREKRSRDRNASGDSAGNNNSSKRRRRNNGKYNRQRRSTGSQNQTPDKSQDGENILSKGQESKIRTSTNNSLRQFSSSPPSKPQDNTDAKSDNVTIEALTKRVVQLETLVSSQMSEMQKLRREMDQMASTMGDVVNFVDQLQSFVSEESNTSFDDKKTTPILSDKSQPLFDDDFEIFGVAPTTIKDAADSAGQSILSAILAGKNRMLVDVRDAELTRDPALLVEFIELAVLPVAAGLQGLDVYTNRVKIVFPTVEELLGYRKYMALAAPEVVSLSTLGFDPVEEKDNLIVIVAPSPDDVAGCDMMQKLLERMSPNANKPLSRPVVIINHHMMPIDTGSIGKFTVVYHLRLLSVQYMTGDIAPEYVNENNGDEEEKKEKESDKLEKSEGDSALEAAMTHAREIGVHQVKYHINLNTFTTSRISLFTCYALHIRRE